MLYIVISPGKNCKNLLKSSGILILNFCGNPGWVVCIRMDSNVDRSDVGVKDF